jgi:triacylglycerol lipase
MLALSHGLLKLRSGANDGMVPVTSTKWGQFRGVLDADHLDLVGLKLEDFKSTFNHLKFLDTLVTELSAKGY